MTRSGAVPDSDGPGAIPEYIMEDRMMPAGTEAEKLRKKTESRSHREITIAEERISAEEYIEFLKRTDLGSQYPKERFAERISKLV